MIQTHFFTICSRKINTRITSLLLLIFLLFSSSISCCLRRWLLSKFSCSVLALRSWASSLWVSLWSSSSWAVNIQDTDVTFIWRRNNNCCTKLLRKHSKLTSSSKDTYTLSQPVLIPWKQHKIIFVWTGCTCFILLASALISSSRFLRFSSTFCLSWTSNWCCSSVLLSLSLVVLYIMVALRRFSCSCFIWNLKQTERVSLSIKKLKIKTTWSCRQCHLSTDYSSSRGGGVILTWGSWLQSVIPAGPAPRQI